LWLGVLLLLAVVPVAVYAGEVTGLTTFVNGQVANADEVNANFAAVVTAVDDSDVRISTLENLLGASCPPSQFVTGISAGDTLVCAP
jgi:hypothetical protein